MITKLFAILLMAAGAAGAADIQKAWFKDKESRKLIEKVMRDKPNLLETSGRWLVPDGLMAWGVHPSKSNSKADFIEAGKISELMAYKEICEHYHGATIRSHQTFQEEFHDDLKNPNIKRKFSERTLMFIRGTIFDVHKVAHWNSGGSVVTIFRVDTRRKMP